MTQLENALLSIQPPHRGGFLHFGRRNRPSWHNQDVLFFVQMFSMLLPEENKPRK